MKVETTDITPAMAAQMLLHNKSNRPIQPRTVDQYVRDMMNGDWDVNGETVKVALDGTLIDGQHRLTAAVKAGYTLRDVVLVRDLPMSVQKTVDGGARRTWAQDLRIAGVSNPGVLVSIVQRAWLWDSGDVKFTGTVRPTRKELDAYREQHASALNRASEIATRTRTAFRPSTPSAVGTAHLITSRINLGDAAEFFSLFSSGAGLVEGDAILALRNRMTNHYADRVRTTDYTRIMMILRAWNAFRSGEKMSRLVFTDDSNPVDPK